MDAKGSTGTLTITTPSDREIAMTRVFDAPRRLVFYAITKPELMMRWFCGAPGWTLTVCESDFRVGGSYRWVWRHESAMEMGMGGKFLEIVLPERIVATEKYDQAWYPGEAVVTQTLVENGNKTTLILTVRYESKEARDGVLQTPAASGVEATYNRLAEFLQTLEA